MTKWTDRKEDMFVIVGPYDDEDGTLYWSNDDGWGFLSSATIFTEVESKKFDLPIEGIRYERLSS